MEKMVNCTAEALELMVLCYEEWHKVVKWMSHVRIERSKPDLNIQNLSEMDSVWAILERDSVSIVENSDLLNCIENKPKIMMEYPRDLFVMDLPKEKVAGWSFLSGVAVFSSTAPSFESVTKRVRIVDFVEGRTDSWERCFWGLKEEYFTPLNSMVIIDRYLFRNLNDGISNFLKILDLALPSNSMGQFDVLLVFAKGHGCLDNQIKNEDITSFIQSLTKKCCALRNYKILLEVLIVSSNNTLIWNDTHDRRVITNYYRIIATHGFSALGGDDLSLPIWSQTITIDCAFSGIDDEFTTDYPITAYDASLRVIDSFVKNPGKVGTDMQFYRNGLQRFSMASLENRLIIDKTAK